MENLKDAYSVEKFKDAYSFQGHLLYRSFEDLLKLRSKAAYSCVL